MIIRVLHKSIRMAALLSIIGSVTGCTTHNPFSTSAATSTATEIPTNTPIPTVTSTVTPQPSPSKTSTPTLEPSPSATLVPPVATSSVKDHSAIIIDSECRAVVDGLFELKKDLGLPEHFMEENPLRRDSDFNPNQYFQVLTHLKVAPGYKLDYVYFNDELGGLPLVYARKVNLSPFQSYSELLKYFGEDILDERSYGELRHKYDYLEQIQIDKSTESYFEFVTLAFLGDQFYLWWHALYNDARILCDSNDIKFIDEELAIFELEFTQDVKDRIDQIDFSPTVLVDETSVTVRYVTFTKWGGFFENVYVMDKENPMQLLDVKFNPLIEYDCGINF